MRTISACLVLASVLIFSGTGCVVDATQTNPTSGQGSVEIDWSISRGRDPNQCAQSAVDSIAIDIFDDSGHSAGSFGAVCESFATSITLYSGNYTANATLIDSAGRPRTTTIAIEPFTVRRGTIIQIPIDFSSRSFF